jgi:hypothetical protein
MSLVSVRFSKTTCGGQEFDTFACLLGRLLGLLIAIDYDAALYLDHDALQYKPSYEGRRH